VCEALEVSLTGAHRAINDTLATAKAFIKMIERYQ
jgi:DNA polymerase III epsilon subunit-like protein